MFSYDDSGFTLTIFMTGSDLFPNASAWVKASTALSVFPSLFSTELICKYDNPKYRPQSTSACGLNHSTELIDTTTPSTACSQLLSVV